jgi:hypothetical protein
MCSDGPDYSQVAQSNEQSAAMAKQAADQELAFRQKVYNDQQPGLKNLMDEATTSSQFQRQQGQIAANRSTDQYNRYLQQSAPMEQQMGLDAMGSQWLSPDQRSQLMQLQGDLNSPFVEKRQAAMQQLTQLQRQAEDNAVQDQYGNANKVRGVYGSYADQMAGLGDQFSNDMLSSADQQQAQLNARGAARRADTTGFYNKQADDLISRAKSKADTEKSTALTQANAAVSTAYGDRARQMQRMGMSSDKYGDMAMQEANANSMARVNAGTQIGGQISNELYQADTDATGLRTRGEDMGRDYEYSDQNQGFGIKSKALDDARALRMGSQQTAAGLRFTGNQQATGMENNARQSVYSSMSAQRQGAANFGRGYMNTSAGNQSLALQGSGQAVGSMNTGVQGQLPSSQFMASGYSPYFSAAQLQQQGGLGLGALQSQSSGGFDWGGLGSFAGGLGSLYKSGIFGG